MNKKASKITLFNKNHITITKETNVKNDYSFVDVKNVSAREFPSTREVQKVKCESPLGFYYTKEVYITKQGKSSDTRVITICSSTETYVITYLISYNQNTINVDLRPWEVCEGEKSMPEHFIFTLKDIIDKILLIVDENKIKIEYNGGFQNRQNHEFKWLKDTIYKELFGSTKGIRFQTDKEKILSHGFDLKTSFRK